MRNLMQILDYEGSDCCGEYDNCPKIGREHTTPARMTNLRNRLRQKRLGLPVEPHIYPCLNDAARRPAPVEERPDEV